jgi:hypothetical protein
MRGGSWLVVQGDKLMATDHKLWSWTGTKPRLLFLDRDKLRILQPQPGSVPVFLCLLPGLT